MVFLSLLNLSSLCSLPISRPRGVQNFRFVVLKKNDGRNKDESSGLFGFLAGLLENFFFLVCAALIVMWCSRKQYVSYTGRHKKRDYRDYHNA